MPSVPERSYWQKRSVRTLLANEERMVDYEKELAKAYEATMKRISTEVEAFYMRYAGESGLDYDEVRKRLKPSQVAEFKRAQLSYLAEAEKHGADPSYKAYLREMSARTYILKLQEIQSIIRQEVELLAGKFNSGLGEKLMDSYEDSFYSMLFDIQTQAKLGVNFIAPGKDQLMAAVKTPWLQSSYSQRIWNSKDKLVATLNQLIPQEFVRGRGPSQMAKDISQRLSVSYSNAVRLARTELNYVSNKGSMQAYKDSGVVSQYQYSSTLDNRTSDICRELDGQVFYLGKAETGVSLPPMHPYCRSTTIPYFADDEISSYITDRAARNADGDTYFVGSNTTYEGWVEKYATASYAKKVAKHPERYAEMNEASKQAAKKEGTPMAN